MPVSCHFRGCKAPLFRIVSGAVSSELTFTFTFWLRLVSVTVVYDGRIVDALPDTMHLQHPEQQAYDL